MAVSKIERHLALDLLERDTYLTDPNKADALYAIVNGWDASAKNIPADAKNKFSMLFTLWTWLTDIGKPETGVEFQLLITLAGKVYCRQFVTTEWSEWATSD